MKNKINFKIVNIALILVIIYLLYLLQNVWLGVLNKILGIIIPFIEAFAIAYVLYPLHRFLTSKKVPKIISALLIYVLLFLVIGLTIYFVVPILFNQTVNLISNLSVIASDLTLKYGIDMNTFNHSLNSISTKVLSSLGEVISSGTLVAFLSDSVSVIANGVIIFIVSIYFLVDMDKNRERIKKFLKSVNKKAYNLIETIDNEIYSYFKGLGIFMLWQLFEYSIIFLIIGHPNFLLVGILASITTVIPYFGSLFTSVLALLIASVISPKLFILTLIVSIILPNTDGYIISPKIYGKTNQLPALLTIFAVFAGGILFGFMGIIISVPVAIIIMAIIKAYKKEIKTTLQKVKEKI